MKKTSNSRLMTIVLAATFVVAAAGCTKETDDQSGTQPKMQSAAETSPAKSEAVKTGGSQEMKSEEIKPGTGKAAETGKTVSVHYTGWLTDGKEFDSSKKRGQPFKFQLGSGQVIKGWDQGVVGMKVGGVRKLIIPPQMAYGDRDVGGGLIPANSTLVFEVELLDVT